MTAPFRIFVVDDDPFTLASLRETLQGEFTVETFESSESCMERIAVQLPDMLLLDLALPGMNGYEFCRQIKDDPGTNRIAVTFISVSDGIDDRMAGYAAGGDDFIVKPIDPGEVINKARVARRVAGERRDLLDQARVAATMTSRVQESMDEAGLLIRFLLEIMSCPTPVQVAAALQHLIRACQLKGLVQVRVGEQRITLNQEGVSSPLEVSVIKHLRGVGAVYESKKQSVHNFDHVTVMISNLPTEVPDLCGRIRENISRATSAANDRLIALEVEAAVRRHQADLHRLGEKIGTTLQQLTAERRHELARSAEIGDELRRKLAAAAGGDELIVPLLESYDAARRGLGDSSERLCDVLEDLARQLTAQSGTEA